MTPPTPPSTWVASTEALLRKARASWRGLVVLGLVGAFVGGGIAIVLPSYYQSAAAFQAESSPVSPISGALAGLASQIGNLQLGTQTNSQFFADLLTTDAVLRRVLADSLPWQGHLATLPAIFGLDSDPPSLRDFNAVKKLRKAIAVDVNIRTGVVRFSIEARTPDLALALVESTVAALNAANVDLRQKRAAAERAFTSDRAQQARTDLQKAEQDLADFYQSNRSIGNSPSLQLREGELKRQVDLAQQVFLQLRLQEEQAALQEVRNTPTISVVDPPILPVKVVGPIAAWPLPWASMVGLAIAVARLLLQD